MKTIDSNWTLIDDLALKIDAIEKLQFKTRALKFFKIKNMKNPKVIYLELDPV